MHGLGVVEECLQMPLAAEMSLVHRLTVAVDVADVTVDLGARVKHLHVANAGDVSCTAQAGIREPAQGLQGHRTEKGLSGLHE